MNALTSRWPFGLTIIVIFCFVAAVCFNATAPWSRATYAQTALAATVPPPPTQRAERFGIYNWNIDYAAYSESSNLDRLNWGAERVAEIGSRTIHAFLDTGDVCQVLPPTQADLVTIAKSPAYDKLFRDARFKTIMLTTYSRGASDVNWMDGYTPAEYAAERDEMQRLGEYLLTNPAFAGKTFILFNWEADGAISPVCNKRRAWDAYCTRLPLRGYLAAQGKA
jgi:hypothetical protein